MHRLISYNYNTSVRRTSRPITMDYIIWCENECAIHHIPTTNYRGILCDGQACKYNNK